MERIMRAVPFWQPLHEKEILPTAESDLEDEMMGKRWRDAALGALLLIGVAVAMAQFFAFVGNLVAQRTASKKPVASSSNASVLIVNEGPSETRPMLKAPEEESAGSAEGAETLAFPDCDSPAGTQFFCLLHAAVYYVLHNGFLLAGASVTWDDFLLVKFLRAIVIQPNLLVICRGMLMMMLAFVVSIMESAVRYSGHPGTAPATAPAKVLMSWSMTNNLMLGSAGIVWEAMGLWLVASLSAVLAVDVLGYLGRAIQALEMLAHGCVDWPEGAKPRDANDDVCPELVEAYGTRSPLPVAEIAPILGPRVDLLKDAAAGAGSRKPVDCVFTASVLQLAACAEDSGTRQRGRVLK
ncbi:unnamed protein product, partial [Symbiodinium necroappetens]